MGTDEQGTQTNLTRRLFLGGAVVVGGAGAVGAWQFRDQFDSGTPDDRSASADQQVDSPGTAWPSMYGNPGLTGFTNDPGPGDTASAGVVWTSDIRGFQSRSSPVVAEDVIYIYGVIAGLAHLVAIGADTGERLWDMPLPPRNANAASLAIDGNRLFMVESGGHIVGFDINAREIAWEVALPWSAWRVSPDTQDSPTAGSPGVALPVVFGDLLYVVANDYVLHAMDISDGSEAWRFPLGFSSNEPCMAQPLAGDGAVIIGSGTAENPDRLYILDAETGDERFRHRRGEDAPPLEKEFAAWHDGDVVVFDEMILRISALTGGGVTAAEGVVPDRQPVVADDAMYIVSEPGDTISRIDRGSEPPLEFSVPNMISGLVAGGETLYFVSEGDPEMPTGLFAYDRQSGEQRWHVELLPSGTLRGLAVYGDRVIVPLHDGQIAAVGRVGDED